VLLLCGCFDSLQKLACWRSSGFVVEHGGGLHSCSAERAACHATQGAF
jgi:hypothetical protein